MPAHNNANRLLGTGNSGYNHLSSYRNWCAIKCPFTQLTTVDGIMRMKNNIQIETDFKRINLVIQILKYF